MSKQSTARLVEWLRIETGFTPDDQYQREAADLIEHLEAEVHALRGGAGYEALCGKCHGFGCEACNHEGTELAISTASETPAEPVKWIPCWCPYCGEPHSPAVRETKDG